MMFQKKSSRLSKTVWVHPLDLASHRAENGLEESLGQVAEAASAQQRRRFVEDIVGGDEPTARLGGPRQKLAGPPVHPIARDQQRVKTAAVDERSSSGRRSGRFLHWSAAFHQRWQDARAGKTDRPDEGQPSGSARDGSPACRDTS